MKYFLLALLASCTTLGPMPGTTAVSAVPAGRPGVEVQAGIIPGYYLSQGAESGESSGQETNALSVAFEPDRLLGIPGLIVGARAAGGDGDRPVEPFIGYRTKLDAQGTFSAAGILYGTRASAAQQGADYTATRGGGELAIDARVLELGRLLSIHAQAAAAVTALSASGHYCTDVNGFATDCGDTKANVDANLSGVFPSATLTISLDAGRRPTGFVQSARLALLGEAGTMPTFVSGEQHNPRTYTSLGLTLTLGLGSDR